MSNPNILSGNFYQAYEEQIVPENFFFNFIREEREPQKSEKEHPQHEYYRLVSIMNIIAKILNKIFTDHIQHMFFKTTLWTNGTYLRNAKIVQHQCI